MDMDEYGGWIYEHGSCMGMVAVETWLLYKHGGGMGMWLYVRIGCVYVMAS